MISSSLYQWHFLITFNLLMIRNSDSKQYNLDIQSTEEESHANRKSTTKIVSARLPIQIGFGIQDWTYTPSLRRERSLLLIGAH